MIRILHTIDTTGPGGAETVFTKLCTSLDPRLFESFAVISGPGWVSDELRRHGVEPIFVPCAGRFNMSYLSQLVRIIRSNKIAVVQSHLLGANLYCSLAGLICRVPVVSTLHGFVDGNSRDKLIKLKSRIINAGSHKVVFVSDRLRHHFAQEFGFAAATSCTIYNGVDVSVFQPRKSLALREELHFSPEHIVIGAIGNIRPAKGYANFLKAARLVREVLPQCRFVIAGEGSGPLYHEMMRLRKELLLDDFVFFLGFRRDAAEVLNALDIFALPSVSEGFSISTLEAMASGVAAVVTKSGGPEEIIEDGVTALLVEPENEKQLADALLFLATNPEHRKRLSQNALEAIAWSFSNRSMVERYSALYAGTVSR